MLFSFTCSQPGRRIALVTELPTLDELGRRVQAVKCGSPWAHGHGGHQRYSSVSAGLGQGIEGWCWAGVRKSTRKSFMFMRSPTFRFFKQMLPSSAAALSQCMTRLLTVDSQPRHHLNLMSPRFGTLRGVLHFAYCSETAVYSASESARLSFH